MTEKSIADRCGYKTGHVKMCLSLQEANGDVKEHIQAGSISSTEAAKLLKQHGSKTGAVIEDLKKEAVSAGQKKVTAATIKAKPAVSKRDLQVAEIVRTAILALYWLDTSVEDFSDKLRAINLSEVIAAGNK